MFLICDKICVDIHWSVDNLGTFLLVYVEVPAIVSWTSEPEKSIVLLYCLHDYLKCLHVHWSPYGFPCIAPRLQPRGYMHGSPDC